MFGCLFLLFEVFTIWILLPLNETRYGCLVEAKLRLVVSSYRDTVKIKLHEVTHGNMRNKLYLFILSVLRSALGG